LPFKYLPLSSSDFNDDDDDVDGGLSELSELVDASRAGPGGTRCEPISH